MKEIKFKWDGQPISAQLGSRIEKKALYGYSRKVAEKDGRILQRGYLSPDGRLLRRDEISQVKVDTEGSPVEETVVELNGLIAELQPSAFEQENELRSSAYSRLASFAVSDVYPVEGLALAPGVYETAFSFRKSVQPKEALLLVKEGESYLLVGEAKQTAFVGLHVAYSFFDAEEEDGGDAEDMDFAMV